MEIRKGQQNGGLHYGKWKQEPTPDSRRKTDHRRRDKQRVKQGSDSRNLREGKVNHWERDQVASVSEAQMQHAPGMCELPEMCKWKAMYPGLPGIRSVFMQKAGPFTGGL